jgi:hypothetical protein
VKTNLVKGDRQGDKARGPHVCEEPGNLIPYFPNSPELLGTGETVSLQSASVLRNVRVSMIVSGRCVVQCNTSGEGKGIGVQDSERAGMLCREAQC